MADVFQEAAQNVVTDALAVRAETLEDLLVTALMLTDEDRWPHITVVEEVPDWHGSTMRAELTDTALVVDTCLPVPSVACKLEIGGGETMADPANVAYAKQLIAERVA